MNNFLVVVVVVIFIKLFTFGFIIFRDEGRTGSGAGQGVGVGGVVGLIFRIESKHDAAEIWGSIHTYMHIYSVILLFITLGKINTALILGLCFFSLLYFF
jgi:hypothetical protein